MYELLIKGKKYFKYLRITDPYNTILQSSRHSRKTKKLKLKKSQLHKEKSNRVKYGQGKHIKKINLGEKTTSGRPRMTT